MLRSGNTEKADALGKEQPAKPKRQTDAIQDNDIDSDDNAEDKAQDGGPTKHKKKSKKHKKEKK